MCLPNTLSGLTIRVCVCKKHRLLSDCDGRAPVALGTTSTSLPPRMRRAEIASMKTNKKRSNDSSLALLSYSVQFLHISAPSWAVFDSRESWSKNPRGESFEWQKLVSAFVQPRDVIQDSSSGQESIFNYFLPLLSTCLARCASGCSRNRSKVGKRLRKKKNTKIFSFYFILLFFLSSFFCKSEKHAHTQTHFFLAALI